MLERVTNGVLRATPHRVLPPRPGAGPRNSIIRFNAVAAGAVCAPLPAFVTRARPARYAPVTMREHMDTTVRNLEAGRGGWDAATQTSTTARYEYVDGRDPLRSVVDDGEEGES